MSFAVSVNEGLKGSPRGESENHRPTVPRPSYAGGSHARRRAKQSFARTCIPKRSLGTRRTGLWNAGESRCLSRTALLFWADANTDFEADADMLRLNQRFGGYDAHRRNKHLRSSYRDMTLGSRTWEQFSP